MMMNADFTNDFYITEDDDDGNDLVFNFVNNDDDDMNHNQNNNNNTDNDTIVSFGDDEDDENNDNNNTIVSLGGEDDDNNDNDDDDNDHDDNNNDNDNDHDDNDNDSAGSTIIQIVPGDDPESDDDYTVEVTTRNGGDSDDESCQTIAELLCGEGVKDFTTVCGLFQEAFPEEDDTATTTGLDNNDGGSSRPTMTLFAPTDQAFAHLSELFSKSDSYSKLLTDDGKYNNMMDIFHFHVTAGTVLQQELLCGELLEMSSKSGSSRTHCDTTAGNSQNNKNTVKIQKGGGNRKNQIEPVILAADILACHDSVIHIISEVMLPNFIDAL